MRQTSYCGWRYAWRNLMSVTKITFGQQCSTLGRPHDPRFATYLAARVSNSESTEAKEERYSMRRRTIFPSGTLSKMMLFAVSLFAGFPVYAQAPSAPTVPPASTPAPATPSAPRSTLQRMPQFSGRRRQKPCWQQAGVTTEAMQKISVIRGNTRTQITAVCTDDSLSHQQKLDKIAGVRKSANQERDALIPPRQREAIHQCELARPHSARLSRKPTRSDDPCAGRLPTTTAASPGEDADPEKAADPTKPNDNSPNADAADPKN
jgi:hypothetical protein